MRPWWFSLLFKYHHFMPVQFLKRPRTHRSSTFSAVGSVTRSIEVFWGNRSGFGDVRSQKYISIQFSEPQQTSTFTYTVLVVTRAAPNFFPNEKTLTKYWVAVKAVEKKSNQTSKVSTRKPGKRSYSNENLMTNLIFDFFSFDLQEVLKIRTDKEINYVRKSSAKISKKSDGLANEILVT